MTSIFLAVPNYGNIVAGALSGLINPTTRGHKIAFMAEPSSLLARNFNKHWAKALNMSPRPDYFAMHHADICAPPGWADVLIDELEKHSAHMVSAIVRIKDDLGDVSMAELEHAEDIPRQYMRRMSWAECEKLPPTFDRTSLPETSYLLVNSALWVCKFAGQPWIEKFWFQLSDSIQKNPETGKFEELGVSEDWLASMAMTAENLKVMATRMVRVGHVGTASFVCGGNAT